MNASVAPRRRLAKGPWGSLSATEVARCAPLVAAAPSRRGAHRSRQTSPVRVDDQRDHAAEDHQHTARRRANGLKATVTLFRGTPNRADRADRADKPFPESATHERWSRR